jgi:hypothetical protein
MMEKYLQIWLISSEVHLRVYHNIWFKNINLVHESY